MNGVAFAVSLMKSQDPEISWNLLTYIAVLLFGASELTVVVAGCAIILLLTALGIAVLFIGRKFRLRGSNAAGHAPISTGKTKVERFFGSGNDHE